MIAKHIFGAKPQLIGIFYNLLRGQVNYDEAKADFENEICKSTLYTRDIILNNEIKNYIDIARSVQEGNVSIKKEDFRRLAQEIINKM